MDTIAAFVENLKSHLREKKDKYVDINEWGGSTETGFYDEITFNMGALMNEIDEFSAQFQKKK